MSQGALSTVSFQFHAHGNEVMELAQRWADDYGFAIAAEQFWPAYRVVAAQNTKALAQLERVDRIAVGPTEFDVTALRTHQFVGFNPGHLFLDVEMPTQQGLQESAVSGATDDPELLRLWRRLIRAERESMHKGARVQSFDRVRSAPLPNHRHTSGAHALAEQGVRYPRRRRRKRVPSSTTSRMRSDMLDRR